MASLETPRAPSPAPAPKLITDPVTQASEKATNASGSTSCNNVASIQSELSASPTPEFHLVPFGDQNSPTNAANAIADSVTETSSVTGTSSATGPPQVTARQKKKPAKKVAKGKEKGNENENNNGGRVRVTDK